MLSLVPLTNLPRLVNNEKKKLDVDGTSESVDGSLWTKSFVKIYIENEAKLRKDSLFIFFSSSKCVKITRLAIQRNPVN